MKKRILPETVIAPEPGEVMTRDVRPFTVTYKGQSITVDLPGYYAASSDEGVIIGDDMRVTDEALRILKERADGLPTPATIKRIRAKLKLSQRKAGALFKVGENAFDKYERGLITPSGPTVQLIKMLDRHPELVDELR